MSSRSTAWRKFITRKAAPALEPVARVRHAERFFAALGAAIRHGGNRAFYSIAADAIPDAAIREFPGRGRLLRDACP